MTPRNDNAMPPMARAKSKSKRMRAMLYSFAFILVASVALPTASYWFAPDSTAVRNAHAQVVNDQNQRANLWRSVRAGDAGYSSVPGIESGILINNGGQNWRQMRNSVIAAWGGWGILAALAAIALFYFVRGKIRVDAAPSGKVVPRWQKWERVMHWYTAILFVVLTITGLSLLFGRLVLIPLLGAEGFALWATACIYLHNFLGPFFSIGVLAMLVVWARNNIPNAVDWQWLKAGGGIIGNAHPSAGKANGGEKIWYWMVILIGLGLVCITGFGLIGWLAQLGFADGTRAEMQLLHQIHSIAALVWIIAFFGHAYIGTIGTEGALEGMTRGSVSVEWAQQHHDLWYDEVKDQARADAGERSAATAAPANPGGVGNPAA